MKTKLLILLVFIGFQHVYAQNWLTTLFTPGTGVKVDTVGNLPAAIGGTSSLFFLDGRLYSCNDHGRLTLYAIDSVTAAIVDSIPLGQSVLDMEEVALDERYIYFGDIGDNKGTRNNLRILRLDRGDLYDPSPRFDTIAFSWPDRTPHNARDFDCEAFVVTDTSIVLFTKQWLSNATALYAIPKSAGSWRAVPLGTLETDGLVTGATFLAGRRLLVLCSYTQLCVPFVYMVYDFKGTDFTGGRRRRLTLPLGIGCQTEGIATTDGLRYHLTCEHLNLYGIEHPAQLFRLDLDDFLGDYLRGGQ